jgi:hypothetical protein
MQNVEGKVLIDSVLVVVEYERAYEVLGEEREALLYREAYRPKT